MKKIEFIKLVESVVRKKLNEDMLTKQAFDRMDGLSTINDTNNFLKSAENIYKNLMADGFEKDEVYSYLIDLLLRYVIKK